MGALGSAACSLGTSLTGELTGAPDGRAADSRLAASSARAPITELARFCASPGVGAVAKMVTLGESSDGTALKRPAISAGEAWSPRSSITVAATRVLPTRPAYCLTLVWARVAALKPSLTEPLPSTTT